MSGPLSKIEHLLNDPEIAEVMIDGWQHVYVEINGKLSDVPSPFQNETELYELIRAILEPLGQRADESNPLVDARLQGVQGIQDGSRINIALPPIALNGPVVTIRRWYNQYISAEDLIRWGSIGQEMYDFLCACILGRLNICVAGGTASGKTTVLHILCRTIPDDERIIVLQSVDEFRLPQPRVVTLESRPANLQGRGEVNMRDLVYAALRMRPDRIILTEARGPEMLDLLQAMNNGHDGTMFSIHSNGIQDALARIEVMAGTGNPSIPLLGLREQIGTAINIICYQERLADGSRKIVKVSEVTKMQDGVVTTRDLFEFRRTGLKDGKITGIFTATGAIPSFLSQLREAGIDLPISMFTPV